MNAQETHRPLIQKRPRPTDAAELQAGLYAGEIWLSPGTPEARELAAAAMDAVQEAFADVGDAGLAQFELSNEAFFSRVKSLRRLFYMAPEWRDRVVRTIVAAGLDPKRTAYDPLKLRVVQSGGADNPAAAPVFQAHRDVWYSHPSCLVTWWVALHEASADETFTFYPEYLERVAPNDSERFDYDDWVKDGPDLKIGWQDIEAGRTAVFPSLTGGIESQPKAELGFQPAAGDELLFAGAHLHQTLAHESGRTRFSVDFRVIDLEHAAAGVGAPLVDARCLGSAVRDYLPVA